MGTEVIPNTEEAVPAEAPTAIEQQIITQIEYYFGNYNLSRDKFLREQLSLDDGWVPLETMVKFNRLKKLSEDFTVITEALKKSPKQLMEISEDCTKIRRRNQTAPPEEYSKKQEELDKRTLYVKGFRKTNTLDELLDFFKEYNVEHVYMRRRMHLNNKPFKGSVMALFETREDAEKFLEKKGLKYSGTELLKEWKVDYVKRKDEIYNNIRLEKEKKLLKRAEMSKEEKENGDKAPQIEMVPGCLLKLSNLDDKNLTREQIKEVFDPLGTVVYVDFSKGKTAAVLRFETGIASSVLEKLTEEDGARTKEIGSCKAVATLIEGDEEKEYWKNIAISRANTRLRFKDNKNFGNKGRFKKWGKRSKGQRGDDEKDDESADPPKKKTKMEASEDKGDPSADMEVSSETKKEAAADMEVSSETKKEAAANVEVNSEAKKEASAEAES